MSTMTDSDNTETHQGYVNRETWAFMLHVNNDQGLYNAVNEFAARLTEDEDRTPTVSNAEMGISVIEYVEELLNEGMLSLDERMIRKEVGSFWRIDRAEVGEAVRESLENES